MLAAVTAAAAVIGAAHIGAAHYAFYGIFRA